MSFLATLIPLFAYTRKSAMLRRITTPKALIDVLGGLGFEDGGLGLNLRQMGESKKEGKNTEKESVDKG
jgi:hypothetical protein